MVGDGADFVCVSVAALRCVGQQLQRHRWGKLAVVYRGGGRFGLDVAGGGVGDELGRFEQRELGADGGGVGCFAGGAGEYRVADDQWIGAGRAGAVGRAWHMVGHAADLVCVSVAALRFLGRELCRYRCRDRSDVHGELGRHRRDVAGGGDRLELSRFEQCQLGADGGGFCCGECAGEYGVADGVGDGDVGADVVG